MVYVLSTRFKELIKQELSVRAILPGGFEGPDDPIPASCTVAAQCVFIRRLRVERLVDHVDELGMRIAQAEFPDPAPNLHPLFAGRQSVDPPGLLSTPHERVFFERETVFLGVTIHRVEDRPIPRTLGCLHVAQLSVIFWCDLRSEEHTSELQSHLNLV